jgi:hypothetical protein
MWFVEFFFAGNAQAVPASRAVPRVFATQTIDQSFQIPVTNPHTHATVAEQLTVTSVRIDSQLPSGIPAPLGYLCLTATWCSSNIDRPYGDPHWGQFFSGIAPLPASSMKFVTAHHRSYPATRIDWLNSTQSSASDDGMLDATYYFLIPFSSRWGSIVVSPTRSMGVEYTGFVGGSAVPLIIGGPTTIPVQLPMKLQVFEAGTASGTTILHRFTGALGIAFLIFFLLIAAFSALVIWLGRRKALLRTRSLDGAVNKGLQRMVVATGASRARLKPEAPTADVLRFETPVVTDEPEAVKINDAPSPMVANDVEPIFRVNVLGALAFDPPVRSLSEPARSLLCYLAFHRDRPLTIGELKTALWPTSRTVKEVSSSTFHNYATEARRSVGSQFFPEAARGSGYQWVNVTTDLDNFEALEQQSRTVDEKSSLELRCQALGLVREYPFASETAHYFEWIRSEGLEGQVIRKITELAYRTALDQIRVGDLVGAESSLRTGLLASPSSYAVWEQLSDVVQARDDGTFLSQHFEQAATYLSASEVAALRDRLRG